MQDMESAFLTISDVDLAPLPNTVQTDIHLLLLDANAILQNYPLFTSIDYSLIDAQDVQRINAILATLCHRVKRAMTVWEGQPKVYCH